MFRNVPECSMFLILSTAFPGLNCMSQAVWLEAVRKCSAAVVGLDLVLGLSVVRRCLLKRSFKRRLVSPMYCKLQRLHWIM